MPKLFGRGKDKKKEHKHHDAAYGRKQPSPNGEETAGSRHFVLYEERDSRSTSPAPTTGSSASLQNLKMAAAIARGPPVRVAVPPGRSRAAIATGGKRDYGIRHESFKRAFYESLLIDPPSPVVTIDGKVDVFKPRSPEKRRFANESSASPISVSIPSLSSILSMATETCPEMSRPATSIFQGPVGIKTYDYLYKLILVGDSATGKTSLMTGFAGGEFSTDYIPTIGVDFTSRIIVIDGTRIKLQLWDTAGNPRFRAITRAYYRGSHGIIVVYDATKEKTFDNVPYWLEEVEKNVSPETTVMLVGSKCDLTAEKVVDYRTATDFADERGIMLMEVSAKDGRNVELAFLTLVARIREADPTCLYSLHRSK